MKMSLNPIKAEKFKMVVDNTFTSFKNNFKNKTGVGNNSHNKSIQPNSSHVLTKKSFYNSTNNFFTEPQNLKAKSQTIETIKSYRSSTNREKNNLNTESIETLTARRDNNHPNPEMCGKNCPNLQKLTKYETMVKELIQENEKMKKINKFFLISMGRKDDNLLTLLNHNNNLTKELHFTTIFKKEADNQPQLDTKEKLSNINLISLKEQAVGMNVGGGFSYSQIIKHDTAVSSLPVQTKHSYAFEPKLKLEGLKNIENSLNNNTAGGAKKSKFIPKMTFKKLVQESLNEKDNLEIIPENSNASKFSMSKLITGVILEKSSTGNLQTNTNQNSGVFQKRESKDKDSNSTFNSTIKTLYNSNSYTNIYSANNPNPSSPLNKRKNKSTSHYENILEMFNKKTRKESIRDTRTSFLTVSNNVLSKIITQDTIREIMRLTNNDDEFLYAMRTYPDDRLIMFSDSIGTLIKDYDYSINLIKRVKNFLQVSIRVVNTLILEDAINMIIKNSCDVLVCDRTSIYVHDKFSNMLVIHAGEGLKKGQFKIPTDKGIVGHVFTTGERLKIDDVYLDERFNRDVDKKTGYKTRSMICVPLRDEDGSSFGVIQGMNKKNGQLFSADDEELIDIFANQASLILKNSMKYDENLSLISRLKMLLNYSTLIHNCTTLYDFSSSAENLIGSFWSSNAAQINIYVESEKVFKHYTSENTFTVKPTNLGLLGKVFAKKVLMAINSGYDSPFYNNIVDLETGFSLVTFPIFDYKIENKLIGIGQVGYPFKISPHTQRPKEMDGEVLNFFSAICSLWITQHFKRINNLNNVGGQNESMSNFSYNSPAHSPAKHYNL